MLKIIEGADNRLQVLIIDTKISIDEKAGGGGVV